MAHTFQTLLQTQFIEVRLHELAATDAVWSDAHRVESPRMVIAQTGLLALQQGRLQLLGQPIQTLAIDDSAPYRMRGYGTLSLRSWVLIPHQGGLHTGSQPLAMQQWLAIRRSARLAEMGDGLALEESCAALLARFQTGAHVPAARCTNQQRLVASVREYLSLHLHERLPLMQIAQAVNVSVFHLCRLFKQATGITIHRALMHLRIAQAVHRLEQGQRDLTQLALDLGFSSHAHFSGAFRHIAGCTPSDWRDGCGRR